MLDRLNMRLVSILLVVIANTAAGDTYGNQNRASRRYGSGVAIDRDGGHHHGHSGGGSAVGAGTYGSHHGGVSSSSGPGSSYGAPAASPSHSYGVPAGSGPSHGYGVPVASSSGGGGGGKGHFKGGKGGLFKKGHKGKGGYDVVHHSGYGNGGSKHYGGKGKKHHKYVYVGTYYDRPEYKPSIAKFKIEKGVKKWWKELAIFAKKLYKYRAPYDYTYGKQYTIPKVKKVVVHEEPDHSYGAPVDSYGPPSSDSYGPSDSYGAPSLGSYEPPRYIY